MTTNSFKRKKAIVIKCLSFFRHQPCEDNEFTQELIKTLLFNKDIIELFRLN